MAQVSRRKPTRRKPPPDKPEEVIDEASPLEDEEALTEEELAESEPVEEPPPNLGRNVMAEELTADERAELEKYRSERKAQSETDKPVEERRGTTSFTGKYRLGSTIDIPLTAGPEAVSKEDVINRQLDLANECIGMLGDSKDPEAVAIRHRLESGNVDELELAHIKTHLTDESHKKAREKLRAEAQQKQQEREKAKQEKQQEREREQQEKVASKGGEGVESPAVQAYHGNEPR